MENKEKELDLIELMKVVWSAKRKLAKWGAIGLVAGLVIAFSIPNEYKTVVQIAPEGSSANAAGAMGGMAAMIGINIPNAGKAGVSEKIYPEIVKSTPFLLEFAAIEVSPKTEKGENAKTITLYKYITEEQKAPWWSAVMATPAKVLGWIKNIWKDEQEEQEYSLNVDSVDIFNIPPKLRGFTSAMSARIKVESESKSGIFKISAKMQDAHISAIVADSLLSKLQRYMTTYYTQKARVDLENHEKMRITARDKYYELDQAYALSADSNRGLVTKSANIQLERLENERTLAFNVYQQLASQVEISRVKLQENTPIATIIEPAIVSGQAESPNKKLIIILFTLLGCFAAACLIVVRHITNNR